MTKTVQAIFLLDETGSMGSVKSQVISGFNEYLKSLQDRKEKVKLTLTLFNSDKIEHRYSGKNVEKVKDLTDKTYRPMSLTPLYDSIASTIKATEKIVDKKDLVLFVIQTDGYENYSKEYNGADVKNLIEDKKKDGWEFVFLGADQDAMFSGNLIGVSSTVSYNSSKSQQTFTGMAAATRTFLDTKLYTEDVWDENQWQAHVDEESDSNES